MLFRSVFALSEGVLMRSGLWDGSSVATSSAQSSTLESVGNDTELQFPGIRSRRRVVRIAGSVHFSKELCNGLLGSWAVQGSFFTRCDVMSCCFILGRWGGSFTRKGGSSDEERDGVAVKGLS